MSRGRKMLEIKNAAKTYGTGENATAALKGVSLTVNDGDFLRGVV